MQRKTCLFTVGFFTTILAAVIILFAGACIPQYSIEKHLRAGMDDLHSNGMFPTIGDRLGNSYLDGSTDMLILTESMLMNNTDFSTVFSNPYYTGEDGEDYIDVLDGLINGVKSGEKIEYVRYWMGFRFIIRGLLTVMNYFEIIRLNSFVFFSLAAMTAYVLGKELGGKASLSFIFSLILMKPHVICCCLQFSCCFLVMMISMLIIPKLRKAKLPLSFVFMEIGMITMYFDFYTTPIITFGFPAVFALLLEYRDGYKLRAKEVFKLFTAWSIGYLMMWLAKLLLATVFTDENGFGNGFITFANWMKIGAGGETVGRFATWMRYFTGIFQGFYQYGKWLLFMIAAFLILLSLLIIKIKNGTISISILKKNAPLLIIAILPLLWFAVAAKPSYNHRWFQYRNLALSFFAVGSWICTSLDDFTRVRTILKGE